MSKRRTTTTLPTSSGARPQRASKEEKQFLDINAARTKKKALEKEPILLLGVKWR